MNQDFQVQRTDYCLKSLFPELTTTIYKISDVEHLIFIHNKHHPLQEENSIFEKMCLFYRDNSKTFRLNEFEYKLLNDFISLNHHHVWMNEKIKLLEQIKLFDFENIDTVQLNNLINDHQFKRSTSNYFNEHIRPITININITDTEVINAVILEPITDKNIVSGFKGIIFNLYQLDNLLLSKFPKLSFQSRSVNRDVVIEINEESCDMKNKILQFLNNLDQRINFILEFKENVVKKIVTIPATSNNKYPNPSLDFISPHRINSFEFEQRDDATFFDNLEQIYSGDFNKQSLKLFNSTDINCFLDYSQIPNQPFNIRNYLLWYDKIFISPPVKDHWYGYENSNNYQSTQEAFRNDHKIHDDDILLLIKQDRIKLILQQPTARYDSGFLQEAYKINPSSIISQRAINTILLMDIVEIFNNYPFKEDKNLKNILDITHNLSNTTKIPQQHLLEILLWPIKAYRQSLELLMFNTHLRFSNIGINSIIERHISTLYKKDCLLEYGVTSPNIHIANALNATYFNFEICGFKNDFYTTTMGHYLNIFNNLSTKNKIKTQSNFLINQPQIELFNINEFCSISEINNIYQTFNTAKSGRPLLQELSDISNNPIELSKKINYYNTAINELKTKGKNLKYSWDIGASIIVGNAIMPFSFIVSTLMGYIIKHGIDQLIDSSSCQKIMYKLIQSYNGHNVTAHNTHFLTKISRVAQFRTKY